jgi:hypothetical protein
MCRLFRGEVRVLEPAAASAERHCFNVRSRRRVRSVVASDREASTPLTVQVTPTGAPLTFPQL